MKYLGDYPDDGTVDLKFNTHVSGVPTALSSGAVSVYKANGTTQTTTGPTLSADFDGVTGLNHVRIATTDSFYATGNDYQVVLTAGTVGGNSVVGTVLAEFSIENRNIKADVVKQNGAAVAESDGTAQGGGASTITLKSGDTSGTNAYVDAKIRIVGGTGFNQRRFITAYNSTTKVATVHRAWDTVPDNTSTYAIDGTAAAVVPDKTGYSLSVTPPTAAAVRDEILNRVLPGNHDTNDTPGKLLQALPNGGPGGTNGLPLNDENGTVAARTLLMSDDVRVKLHGTQPDYAPLLASSYAAPLNAAGIRSALGLASANLDTQLAPLGASGDVGRWATRGLTMIALNGSVYRYTAAALALAPVGEGGGGGSTTVVVTPLIATTSSPSYTTRDLAPVVAGSGPTFAWTIQDANREPVDLSAKDVRFVAALLTDPVPTDPFDDTFGAGFSADATIGGDDNNVATVTLDNPTATGLHRYWLLNVTDRVVLATGKLPVVPIAAGAWD